MNYVQQDLFNEDLYLPLDFKMISAKVSTIRMAPCAYCPSCAEVVVALSLLFHGVAVPSISCMQDLLAGLIPATIETAPRCEVTEFYSSVT